MSSKLRYVLPSGHTTLYRRAFRICGLAAMAVSEYATTASWMSSSQHEICVITLSREEDLMESV